MLVFTLNSVHGCSLRKYNLKLERQVSGYTKQTESLRQNNLQKYTQMNRIQGNKTALQGSTIQYWLKANVTSDYTHPLIPSLVLCHGVQRGQSQTSSASTMPSICATKTSVLLFMVSHCCNDKLDLLKHTKFKNFKYISDEIKTICHERYCETGN